MPVVQGLSAAPSAPAQHKQPSRKGKKAWRKNVDVTEIEQGLEERNEQIIQGGILAEKESKDLFDIDTKGDADSKKSIPTRLRGLKADEILAQRSAVPSVSMRKRAASKVGDGLVETKRLRKDWVSHKDLSRLKRVADGQHDSIEVHDASYDLWDANAEPEPLSKKNGFNFLPEPSKAKLPRTMKEMPISLAANGKAIPAVKKPAAGFSYNPTFESYEDRLKEESAKALEAEKQRLAQEEADRLKAEAAARSAAEAEAAEAKLDMSEWEEDSAWEGFESGVEDAKSAKKPQRKTQAQRNRIKRRKEEEQAAKHKKAMKQKHEQLRQLKKISKEVAEKEAALALAKAAAGAESSESEGDDTVLRRKAVTKTPVLEQDLEIVLPDELQDSLRALKPEGNLLKDRYRSLLVRGRVEARKRIPFRKQAKGKLTEKWTYKDFKLQ
ncbi:hypothetical protein TD95_002999 [Thielaviopsis punctulata]|uniref:Ribosome biogenesis protein NOP53 n=1 Tax=Thielaviopsis punctulata TaxID=72032 RepID=A0A0F4ZEH9_9PEZI|nr:hypothetical protein TD95_002999 [Thielaviopsis punctulata]